MAVLSLPLSFNNSFWSQDYRKGLEVLYAKLEQGAHENDEVVGFIRARARAESQVAHALSVTAQTQLAGAGFGKDDGASLLMAFQGLQAESANQGQAHATVAKELAELVAEPFEQWAHKYKDRLAQSKANIIDGYLDDFEEGQASLIRLKRDYQDKVRRADEALDEARLISSGVDNYTTSPKMRPIDAPREPRTPPLRSTSVSEKIANRLKELQKRAVAATAAAASEEEKPNETVFESPASPESATSDIPPKVDKGKGREIDPASIPKIITSSMTASPNGTPTSTKPPGSPLRKTSIQLGHDVSLAPEAVSALLSRAAKELRLRPVRFPLIGEYPSCFSGEEFVEWILSNIPQFSGDWEQADDACRNLTEKEGLLRRVGELGNAWEPAYDAWYQFRPKAFELGKEPIHDIHAVPSPIATAAGQRITSFASLVSKAITQASTQEPTHVLAMREADSADAQYKLAARRLDRQRLNLEERIEECLKTLQRWELERLSAVKTCLLQFQGTLSNLPSALAPSVERSSTLISAFQPQNDLTALIERYRTGPFRPKPVLYESVAHDERDVLFGGDLRKWSEAMSSAAGGGKDVSPVPLVLVKLLQGLDEVFKKAEKDDEKRKAWIYEVPLPATHHLRERLNASVVPSDPTAPETDGPPQTDIDVSIITEYDAPVIASTVKLWLLELDPPIGLWEGWDEFRKIYPSVGGALKDEDKPKRIEAISSALMKLPKIHLQVLDKVVGYLVQLIGSTKSEESDEVFISKLALSIGRTLLRPKNETELSVQDRHQTLFVVDLISSYAEILPPTLTKKKRESERKIPIRKRTAMVDMRLSRSKLQTGAGQEEHKRMLHAQHVRQNPSISKKGPAMPPVPALPKDAQPIAGSPPPPAPPAAAEAPAAEAPKPAPKPIIDNKPSDAPDFADMADSPTDDAPPMPDFKDPVESPKSDNTMPDFKEPPPEPPSPTKDEGTSPTSALSRNSSGGVKGPRTAMKGPRAPSSGNRPSSVLGRASAFERRTMESDAEDNVVNGP